MGSPVVDNLKRLCFCSRNASESAAFFDYVYVVLLFLGWSPVFGFYFECDELPGWRDADQVGRFNCLIHSGRIVRQTVTHGAPVFVEQDPDVVTPEIDAKLRAGQTDMRCDGGFFHFSILSKIF